MGRLNSAFEEKLVTARDLAVFKAQSINDLGSGSDDVGQAAISASTDSFRTIYRVDYSDYSNFVFFNSALDYFNISGERIINDFPRYGTATEYLSFISASDDYQRWLFENSWPATLGHSYWNEMYVQDPNSSFVPGSKSFSVELHTYTGWGYSTSGTIAEKAGSWAIFYSGSIEGTSSINFKVIGTSGSVSASYVVSYADQLTNAHRYLSFVCDRDSEEIRIIHGPDTGFIDKNQHVVGLMDTYPREVTVLVSASTSGIGDISGSNNYMTVSSGTYGSGLTMAAFSYWSKARTVEEIKNSYAGNIYAQDNLIALYRFDENIQINDAPNEVIVRNAAGDDFDIHLMGSPAVATYSGINGEFIGGYDQNLILTMSRTPVPVTKFAQAQDLSATLEDYVRNAQITASLYDKGNTNIITRMVPDAYLSLEEEIGTEVLQKFLYLIGRQFDQIKVAIDQFTNWNKSNYTGFDDTPDSLLRDAANFYGWDFVGNFLNHNALKYFFGKDVVQGSDLDVKLYQIKNEFWRRTLNELMHIYKTKGTRESVESLIRVYGMDQKLIKLKEYGVKPNGKIETNRINSHRSLPAFCIPSGTGDAIISNPMTDVDGFEIALHGKFYPLDPLDQPRGTICSVGPYELRYFGTAGSVTTSLALVDTISGITGAIGNVPIMDGHWWNIFATIPTPGGTLASNGFSYQFPVQFGAVISSGTISWSPGIAVQRLNEDTVVDRYAFSATYTSSTLSGTVFSSTLGHSTFTGGTFYVNEFKLYNDYLLNYEEMDAQTLDFQSYGVLDIDDLTGSLRLHWRLDDDLTIPAGVSSSDFKVFDFSGYGVSGTISSSIKADPYNPFRRFMYDYNFIAPVEYGWNENKIRVYDGSKINPNDYFAETNALALEFNLIDSLNEDISKMLATMNNWNNVLGVPANKFRENYPDLQRMRNYYFKKLEGRINFTRFADILEFFDRSFVKMIQRLLPARAIFYGEEFVIESHMLERPKVQWTYRRYSPELVPEGRITMTDRSGSFNSSAVTTISYS